MTTFELVVHSVHPAGAGDVGQHAHVDEPVVLRGDENDPLADALAVQQRGGLPVRARVRLGEHPEPGRVGESGGDHAGGDVGQVDVGILLQSRPDGDEALRRGRRRERYRLVLEHREGAVGLGLLRVLLAADVLSGLLAVHVAAFLRSHARGRRRGPRRTPRPRRHHPAGRGIQSFVGLAQVSSPLRAGSACPQPGGDGWSSGTWCRGSRPKTVPALARRRDSRCPSAQASRSPKRCAAETRRSRRDKGTAPSH